MYPKSIYSTPFFISSFFIFVIGLFLWWVIIAHHYIPTALVAFLLYRTARTTEGPLGRHAAVFLVLVCVVWGFNAVYVSGNSPVPNMDLGPLGFFLVAAAMAAGGYAEVILSNAPKNGPLRESLLKIIEQVERIGDINKKLLKITQYKAGNN